MSLYNGYFAERFNLDPFGFKSFKEMSVDEIIEMLKEADPPPSEEDLELLRKSIRQARGKRENRPPGYDEDERPDGFPEELMPDPIHPHRGPQAIEWGEEIPVAPLEDKQTEEGPCCKCVRKYGVANSRVARPRSRNGGWTTPGGVLPNGRPHRGVCDPKEPNKVMRYEAKCEKVNGSFACESKCYWIVEWKCVADERNGRVRLKTSRWASAKSFYTKCIQQ